MTALTDALVFRVLAGGALSLGLLVFGGFLGGSDHEVYQTTGVVLILSGGAMLALTGFYLFGAI